MKGHFKYWDHPSAFSKSGKFSPWFRWLEVSAPGYQTLKVPLPRVLGDEIDLDGNRPFTVKLTRGQTPADPYKDLAGVYQLPIIEYYGGCIELRPDGRFAWLEWTHRTSNVVEYGTFRREGDRIHMTRVPGPKQAIQQPLRESYRIIRWGDGLFLCETDDDGAHALARWSLRPPGAEPLRAFDRTYHRGTKTRKPAGLPRLNASDWARFAYHEVMDRGDYRSVYRTWREALTEAAYSNLGGDTFRFVAGAILPELARERED